MPSRKSCPAPCPPAAAGAALAGGFGAVAFGLVGGIGLELCLELGLGCVWELGSGLEDVDHQQADGHGDGGGGNV